MHQPFVSAMDGDADSIAVLGKVRVLLGRKLKTKESVMKFDKLAIDNAHDLRFGFAPHPVTTRHGLVIGGGVVYPELNFTLPPITISTATMPEIREHYRSIVDDALTRARTRAARRRLRVRDAARNDPARSRRSASN